MLLYMWKEHLQSAKVGEKAKVKKKFYAVIQKCVNGFVEAWH
jgi:hypothetical protein